MGGARGWIAAKDYTGRRSGCNYVGQRMNYWAALGGGWLSWWKLDNCVPKNLTTDRVGNGGALLRTAAGRRQLS